MNYQYNSPGEYAALFTITDFLSGESEIIRQYVIVNDAVGLDTQLRSIFAEFTNRLSSGAIDGSLNYLSGPMRDKLEEIFIAHQADLPQIASNLGSLEGGGFSRDFARYSLVKEHEGEITAFPLFFIRDENGAWVIGGI